MPLRHLALATVVLVPFSQARADWVVVMGGKLHAVPSKLQALAKAPDQGRLKSATFVKLVPEKQDGGYSYVVMDGLVSLPAFTLASKSSKPRIPKEEGCGEYPMRWLPKAKVIGKLKKKAPEGTLFLEVPPGFTPVKEVPAGLEDTLKKELFEEVRPPESDEEKEYLTTCLKNTRVFTKDGSQVAYTSCMADLNESFRIYQAEGDSWLKVDELTITDECP